MIYNGQMKIGNSIIESSKLWKLKETPMYYIFERVSGGKSLRVKKNQTGRWGYVRPLYEDSWVIFDKWGNVYSFSWGVDNSLDY